MVQFYWVPMRSSSRPYFMNDDICLCCDILKSTDRWSWHYSLDQHCHDEFITESVLDVKSRKMWALSDDRGAITSSLHAVARIGRLSSRTWQEPATLKLPQRLRHRRVSRNNLKFIRRWFIDRHLSATLVELILISCPIFRQMPTWWIKHPMRL